MEDFARTDGVRSFAAESDDVDERAGTAPTGPRDAEMDELRRQIAELRASPRPTETREAEPAADTPPVPAVPIYDEDGNEVDELGFPVWTGRTIDFAGHTWQWVPPTDSRLFFFSGSSARTLPPKVKIELTMGFLRSVLSERSMSDLAVRVMDDEDFDLAQAFALVSEILEAHTAEQELDGNRRTRRALGARGPRAAAHTVSD